MGLVNDGSELQSSELSLHDLTHYSLIGRVLELWILLERRLLPWCVAELAAGGSRDLLLLGMAGKGQKTSNNCFLKRCRESRRLQ
jgi:predicted Kef-type K+ transport protein